MSFLFYRDYEKLYTSLDTGEQKDILRLTGCLKPCQYLEYRRMDLDQKTAETFMHYDFMASLMLTTTDTIVEREVPLYSFPSLVAEFGGALGLFLGFSFMTPWYEMENLLSLAVMVREKWSRRSNLLHPE